MRLAFVICVSDPQILARNALASPGLARPSGHQTFLMHGCRSAADGFNAALVLARSDWLVFLHQDVFLPEGWDTQFLTELERAQKRFPRLAVVGPYGVQTLADGTPMRAGKVRDRGRWLDEPAELPCAVQSLDELLFAVRRDSGLQLDPHLGFDLYATDLVLSARARGLQAAVVKAPCHHNSGWMADAVPEAIVRRFSAAAAAFAAKWRNQLPIHTPCWPFVDAKHLPPGTPPL